VFVLPCITSHDISFVEDRLDDALGKDPKIGTADIKTITRGQFKGLLRVSSVLVDSWKQVISF